MLTGDALPACRGLLGGAQPFVFVADPTHHVGVDARQEWIQRRAVEGLPYEPFRSPGGRVLSIQSTSATLHLSSFMAYFSTHLFLSGKMAEVPLYELDMLELYEKARKAWTYTLMTLVGHNLGLILRQLAFQGVPGMRPRLRPLVSATPAAARNGEVCPQPPS